MKKALSLALALTMLLTVIPMSAFAAQSRSSIASRDEVITLLELVNDNWITKNQSHGRSFWDNAAYHTGNMEAYATTGIEAYKEYSEAWAIQNGWKGATSTNPAEWTSTYDESARGVLFGDWQICFQTYVDLYNFDETKDPNKIARAREVMEYEMNTGRNDFWWWADGLYMVMPVMTKLYRTTQNKQYLDKLYEFYRYAKSVMYDGPDGYAGASNYTYMFHRDGKYIATTHLTDSGKKDFWARGQGWVFAGLSKVLNDVPSDWEHRDYFINDYLLNAQAIAACQQPEGYWSRSMLDKDYAPGYETSGTAFFLYGFLWGVNNGYLDEETYQPTIIKAYNYLKTIAIDANGVVGYVQPIGENARQSLNIGPSNTSNFGVGATLLALSELSRYVGGLGDGDLYPYLQRKLVGTLTLEVDTQHLFDGSHIFHIDESDHQIKAVIKDSRTLVPVRVIAENFGCTVGWDAATQTVTAKNADGSIDVVMQIGVNSYSVNGVRKDLDVPPEIISGRTFIPLRAMTEAIGKQVYWNQQYKIITISDYANLWDDERDAKLLSMLDYMLREHKYLPRPDQPKSFERVLAAKGDDEYTATKITASVSPEPDNPATNAIDSDYSTRWAGNGTNPTLTVDYGQAVSAGQVAVAFWKSNQRTTNYEFAYSVDGSTWTDIYKGNSTLNAEYDVFDLNTNVRYLRVIGHGNSENEWTSVLEVCLYKPGASAKTATGTTAGTTSTTTTVTSTNTQPAGSKLAIVSAVASQQPEGQNPATASYDGNLNTVWASQNAANIVYDLGGAKNVTGVGVAFKLYEDDRTIPFRVFISADNTSWTQIYSGSSVARSNAYIWASLASATSARYVKVEVDGNTVSGWTSLAEVQVFGN